METYSYQKTLPSCTLNRALLAEIEKRLMFGVPKLMQQGLAKVLQGLGLKDHKKLENYQIIVETVKESRTLQFAKQMPAPYFDRRTRQVSILYKLGAPRILTIEITFPQNARPKITMTTQSHQVEKLLPRIADGLYSGIDFFLLYSSMGWLCLLSLGIVKSLPHMFPWVTFETQSRFQLERLPLLVKFSLLFVSVGCYISLVLLNMPRTNGPGSVLLAGLVG